MKNMNNKLIISLFIIIASILPNLSHALPAPCTPEELLDSSDFAIEGIVTKVECGKPYDSTQCNPNAENTAKFVPELVSKCSATVKVAKNIKGQYNIGDDALIPFIKLVQKCENGNHIIPGSPVKNFVLDSKIKYYSSEQCKYWNYIQISVPTDKSEDNGKN